MQFVSRVLLVFSLLAVVAPAASAAPGKPPKLVVVLVVDQMRGDYIDRYAFQWTGGLRRLVTEGAWFRRAAYPYLTTVTCVGHATISTGSFPRTHGIVGNSWFDREAGRTARCAEDPGASAVSYADAATGGVSAARLMATTLADELRSQLPGPTRVVTFSMKDRTAVMLAGRRADAATWFSPTARGFVTSSAFTAAPVPFVANALKARPVAVDFGTSWTRLLPVERYLYDDRGPGEKSSVGWTSEFPHVLKGSGDQPDPSFYTAWETSPFSDAYLGGLAVAAIDALKLGQGRGTDFLGISFSALDSGRARFRTAKPRGAGRAGTARPDRRPAPDAPRSHGGARELRGRPGCGSRRLAYSGAGGGRGSPGRPTAGCVARTGGAEGPRGRPRSGHVSRQADEFGALPRAGDRRPSAPRSDRARQRAACPACDSRHG